jgi:hypothetical protein
LDGEMKKLAVFAATSSLVAAAFVAGVAVGKTPPPAPRFVAAEEVKWDDLGGLKLGTLVGDYKKGPYGALLKLPAGYRSELHAQTGAYEAVQIAGTSSHWLRGEDGTKAKKMTPGSYWTIPAKVEHVSACAPGVDCIIYISQKTKYDVIPTKDTMLATGSAAGAGSAVAGAGSGSAAKAGAGSGSAAKAGSAASAAIGVKATGAAGTGSGSGAKK